MKTLIRCSAITCFAFAAVLFGSCSNETPALEVKNVGIKVQNKTPKQQSPQLLSQQFGGCKAHQ